MPSPTASQVSLKPRGPVAWTLISLLVPFGILVWLHKSRRQIDFINQSAGRPQRLISPWWLTGPILALFGFLLVVLVVALVINSGTVDDPVPADSTSEVTSDLGDSTVGGGLDGLAADTDDDGDDAAVTALFGLFTLLTFVIGVGMLVAWIIYLLKHIDGVVALAGTNDDKTLLLVMGLLGALVFSPLLVFVVYKSQEILNQAIADFSGAEAA